jgi:hypothetical protein
LLCILALALSKSFEVLFPSSFLCLLQMSLISNLFRLSF